MAGEPLPETDEPDPGAQYGTAWGLDDDFDLRPNGRGGWAKKHDEAAVEQDEKVAVLTPYGTDPLRPTYGRQLSELLGSSVPAFKTELERVLGLDPRVESVEQVDVDFETPGDRENVNATVTLRLADGELLDFNFTTARYR